MNAYNVSFTAPEDGGTLVDVHNSTGTSRYLNFRSLPDLRTFFSSLGLHEEKIAEVETICSNLHAGEAYHENMFLPECVIEAIEKLRADVDMKAQKATASH